MKHVLFAAIITANLSLFAVTDEEWQEREDRGNPERKEVDEKLTELYKTLQGDEKKHFVKHYLFAGTYKHPIKQEPYASIFKDAGLLDAEGFPLIVFNSGIKHK